VRATDPRGFRPPYRQSRQGSPPISVGFSLFATESQRLAALPLLEAGVVDALEWTVDLGWGESLPAWATALLETYGEAGRLYGHGVTLSPTSARSDDERWLAQLASDPFRYRHVTEHWGFSRTHGLLRGAPMPVIPSMAAIEATIGSMQRLAAAARVPVGLENLALALGADDVDAQPAMLASVLDAVDGVLLLDLHNLWCQAVNYERDPRELVGRYPLARVRQLHVAGGSWSASAYGKPFRRDTHDALVPDEVLELVAWTIPRCPALEVVILERIPDALGDHDAWRAEWTRLRSVVERAAGEPIVATQPPSRTPLDERGSIDDVARFQDAMTCVLLRGGDARMAHASLLAHRDAAPFRDQIAGWELRALEVAIALANKWGVVDGQVDS
jgi:uncharacterized protein (UPF0276 family)